MKHTMEGTAFYLSRILIVDDDPASVATLKNCFQSCGGLFKVVINGKKAIEELSSNHRYDLVILDWKMPDMTGGDTLVALQQLISKDPALNSKWMGRKVPVLVYTG